ncbi:MAG: hypothetical protein N2556_02375 [Anaerolineae bacterium]|nr:hypothetical protein [Anaerolineae bacterium]
MRESRFIGILIILLVALCLMIGIVGIATWAYAQYPDHPVFVFLSGATTTPTSTRTPPPSPTPVPTQVPSPTSSPTPSPTPTLFKATSQPRPTRYPSPTPTPEPTVVLPAEAVPLPGGVPIPADLYFIRDGGLWRWSEQGKLEQLVAPPQQSGTAGSIRARPVAGALPRPTGVTNYRLSPDGRFVIYSYTRRERAEYRSEIRVLVLETGETLYLPTTAMLSPSSPITPDIDIVPDGKMALYLAWGVRPTVPGGQVFDPEEAGNYGTILAVEIRNPNREYELGYCAGRKVMLWDEERQLLCRGFVLSPDGARVAFVDGRGIWVSDFSGRAPRLVAEHQSGFCGIWQSVRWSPDGKSLLAEMVCSETGGLTLIEVETGARYTLHPTWRHVGFVTTSLSRQRSELLVAHISELETGYLDRISLDHPADKISLLSSRNFWPTYPVELLDGRIAMANQRCAEMEGPAPGIYTVAPDGRDLRFLSPLPAVSCETLDFGKILWSPDGRAYLYLRDGRPLLLGMVDGPALWDVQELLSGAHTFQWKPPYAGYFP